ncbi:MAG: LysR family transcriptional regulator [Acetobacter papayae]
MTARTDQPLSQDERRFITRADWNLFRQFYEIARCGSISAAARSLGMHQPGLSLSLRRLEEQVGVQLCRRTPQGIALTPAGKAVFEQITEAAEAVRMVPHVAREAARRIEGTLRLSMISDILCQDLDDALTSFSARHPDVTVRVEIRTWRNVLDAVQSGEADVGVTYESESVPTLRYEPMLRESQQLYCGRAHPLFGHSIRNPATLAGQRFILAAADEPADVGRFRLHYDLGKNTVAQADDLSEAMRLIRLGLGIGFLPTIVAEPLGERLWPLLPGSLRPSYFVYLITGDITRLSTPAQLFHEEILRRLRARPGFR